MSKVLVTGGAGFVGKHLLQSLSRRNNIYSIVVDDLSNSKLPDFLLKYGKLSDDCIESPTTCFYRVDIRDKYKLESTLSKYDKIDVCIHLAAKISVSDSLKYPQETFDVNVNGTEIILDVCNNLGIENFVLASSAAVYGNPQRLPLSETETPLPISPYGESKSKAEQLVSKYSKNIPNAVSTRFFNIYGYGQSPEYAGVITKFAQRLKDGHPPIIYGDGQQIRDFISVEDVVRAIMLAARIDICQNNDNKNLTMLDSTQSNIFNIGTGVSTTISDLANIMMELFRLKKADNTHSNALKPIYRGSVEGDIFESYADTTKAEQYLGFKYRDELHTGLRQLYRRF